MISLHRNNREDIGIGHTGRQAFQYSLPPVIWNKKSGILTTRND